jgi:hypothetical protein
MKGKQNYAATIRQTLYLMRVERCKALTAYFPFALNASVLPAAGKMSSAMKMLYF